MLIRTEKWTDRLFGRLSVITVFLLMLSPFALTLCSSSGASMSGTSFTLLDTALVNNMNNSSASTTSIGFITETLVLSNNTVVKGNFVPSDSNNLSLRSVVYNPMNKDIYVAAEPDMVFVINSANNSVTDIIKVGNDPEGILVDPENGNVYVANAGSNNVSVINWINNSVIDSVQVGIRPLYLAYDPVDASIFVTDSGTGITYLNEPGNISVINTGNNTVSSIIPLTGEPTGIAFNPSNKEIDVAEYASGQMIGINTSSGERASFEGSGASGIPWIYSLCYNPYDNEMYVGGLYQGQVYVVNSTNDEVAVIQEGYPFNMFFDPANNYVYVVASDGGAIIAINSTTNTNVGSIQVNNINGGLYGGAYDSENGFVYLSGPNSALYILKTAGPSTAKFTVHGLRAGTQWSVTMNGFRETTMGNSIEFNEPNGSYKYAFSSVDGYISMGNTVANITLNGSMINVNVTFISNTTAYVLLGSLSGIIVAAVSSLYFLRWNKLKK